MPRSLYWLQGSSTSATRPKKDAATPARKRPRIEKTTSDVENEVTASSSKGKCVDGGKINSSHFSSSEPGLRKDRPGSSSPPPEPLSESSMDEGMEYDDKYRMVEDEFLTVAQRFTVHLHAAEYKKQQKIVKSRNAEIINSISRPVTGRMPAQTRKKAEAAKRTKNQRSVLEGILGKKEPVDSDDSEGDGLPYFGTSLHGLMDSPRKKAASLAKLQARTATRAAAGFKKPVHSKPDDHSASIIDSPISKRPARSFMKELTHENGVASSSEDEDDDLDAPIPAPKFLALGRKAVPPSKISSSGFQVEPRMNPTQKIEVKPKLKGPTEYDSSNNMFTKKEPIDPSVDFDLKPARLSRFEMARRRQAEAAKSEEKERLDLIPTFL